MATKQEKQRAAMLAKPKREPVPAAGAPYMLLPLADGSHAKIDAEDAERVSRFNWQHSRNRNGGRVKRSFSDGCRQKHQPLASFILNAAPGDVVDHRNGDYLDNRKGNLRLTTQQVNMQNKGRHKSHSSRFKGVSLCSTTGLWRVTIAPARQTITLGRYRDEVSAARAYDAAALSHFGEFARTNVALGLLPPLTTGEKARAVQNLPTLIEGTVVPMKRAE